MFSLTTHDIIRTDEHMEYNTKHTLKQNIGFTYEHFVAESIKKEYDKVWLWRDFPESILHELNIIKNYDIFCKYRYDLGADVVAMKNNTYYFIQCKNFKNTLCINDLGGFYFFVHEYNLNGLVYHNGQLSQRISDLSQKITYVNLPYNTEQIYVDRETVNKIIPRQYQIDAYNSLKNCESAMLSLPCGMGKTYISSMIANDFPNVIILSPLKCLAQQSLNCFHHHLDKKYTPILISSDGCRNIDKIKKLVADKNIFSSTYDSADIVFKLLNSDVIPKNKTLIVVDEFHNMSENNINKIDDNMKKLLSFDIKKLYVSATPISNIKCDKVYKYEWTDAIKNKYICDFKIIVPDIESKIESFKKFIGELSSTIDVKIYCKAYFILKNLVHNGNKKCICYLTTIGKAVDFGKNIKLISDLLNIRIKTWQIDCNTKRTNRETIVNEFKECVDIGILINVHILDEGINIEECDSVYVTQPNNDISNLIQRMSRANRITQNKEICYVYLWSTKNKADKILKYVFDKTCSEFTNKVFTFNVITSNVSKIKVGSVSHSDVDKIINTVDICSYFINEFIEDTPHNKNNRIHCVMLYTLFQKWCEKHMPDCKLPSDKEFGKKLRSCKHISEGVRIGEKIRRGIMCVKFNEKKYIESFNSSKLITDNIELTQNHAVTESDEIKLQCEEITLKQQKEITKQEELKLKRTECELEILKLQQANYAQPPPINDHYLEFLIKKTITAPNTKHIHCSTLYNKFKIWMNEKYPDEDLPNNKIFVGNIRKHRVVTKIKINGNTQLGVKNTQLVTE